MKFSRSAATTERYHEGGTLSGGETLVELRGIEPLTSSMPWKRSAN